MYTKKIFLTLIWLLLLLWLSSCSEELNVVEKKYYSTWSVFTGSINITNSFVWYIKWDQMVELSSKIWWRISNIYVKEGDFVNKGDLLAKLDSLEAKVWYWSAENIVTSLYELKKSIWIMYDEQINTMNEKVKQAILSKEGSNNAIKDVTAITIAQLETAKIWVESAQINLFQTKLILETKWINIYDNSKSAIVNAVILDTNIIKFIDELLWITTENKDKNDKIEDYLSAKNISYLQEAKVKFIDANKIYLEYKSFYDINIDWKKPSKETILIWLEKWEILAEKLKSLLDSTYNVLNNSIENISLSSESIANYKKTVSDFWKNIEWSLLTVSWNYLLWLKWSRQWLNNFDKESNLQIDLLEKQLLLAQNQYIQYKTINDWDLRKISTQSKVAISWLNEIKSGLEALKKEKKTKLKEIDIKIKEAIWEKNIAGVMINNWNIYSPITWVITSKLAEEGQVIWWASTILIIADEDNLKLNIILSEIQSKNIQLSDKVSLEIEWIDKQVIWKITNIFPSKDLITKKLTIEISLANPNKLIKIWSYTKVSFINSSFTSSHWVLIPNSAIISKFMIPGVYSLKDWIVEFKNIEILKQNDNFSEITWLKIWETIILEWKENIWDWEELN